MRKIQLGAALVFSSLTALAQVDTVPQDTVAKRGPMIEFERMEINDTVYIDKTNTAIIKEKDYKYAEFRFKNTGDEPLLIEAITQSSPCFSGEWPRQPIKPGEGGVIRVTCPGKPLSKEMVMGFTVATNDPAGIKLLVLKRKYVE